MAQVLIIEDDPDFAMSLELVLGLRDLSAVLVGSAEEALELLEEQDQEPEIRVAFMDIKLPGMDGIECLRQIRMLRPGITCVVMTGFRDRERLDRVRSAGAAEILLKPFGMEHFLTLVEKYL